MLPAILAGLGLVKGIGDAKQAREDKNAEALRDAAMIKWSPWSKIDANKFAGNNYTTTSQGLAGGLAGLQAGQNIENAVADTDYRKAIAAKYKRDLAGGTKDGGGDGEALQPEVVKYNFSPYSAVNSENLLKGQAVKDMPLDMSGWA